jgi:hypothetical protein
MFARSFKYVLGYMLCEACFMIYILVKVFTEGKKVQDCNGFYCDSGSHLGIGF